MQPTTKTKTVPIEAPSDIVKAMLKTYLKNPDTFPELWIDDTELSDNDKAKFIQLATNARDQKGYLTLTGAIKAAEKEFDPVVICRNETHYVLYPIKDKSIGSEESECYLVAAQNGAIAIAVYTGILYGNDLKYCDL